MKLSARKFLFIILLLPFSAFAQLHLYSYYPQVLLDLVDSQVELSDSDQLLKDQLYQTLALVHLQVPGERDELFKSCPSERPEHSECREQLKNMTYQRARQYLFGLLHLEKQSNQYVVVDQYCGETLTERDGVGPMKIPNHQLINCEHTWPQSRFNPRYNTNLQKTDLHHLYPVNNRANSSRGNILFGDVADNQSPTLCAASKRGPSTSRGTISFEPPDEHKGNVARAIFYFAVRYKIDIPAEEEAYLRQWNRLDPVDDAEKLRNEKIYQLQGNRNPFIDDQELVYLIQDL